MTTPAPEVLRQLVSRWRSDGSPTQRGFCWSRDDWVRDFPQHADLFRGMPDHLDRETLRALCARAPTDARSAEEAFVAVMVWGYGRTVGYGRFRTKRILTATPDAGDRLLMAARTLADVGAMAAYGRLARREDCRLRWLGPAFGTKYLHFCQPRGQLPTALIHDRVVAAWVRRETALDLDPGAWAQRTYRQYLDVMHAWASELTCRPDELEGLIFKAEQDAGKGADACLRSVTDGPRS